MDFVTIFTKKYERGNNVYLACSKRGPNNDKCKGKAKHEKNKNIIKIYESCVNNPVLHNQTNFSTFKQMYEQNNFNNISMNLKLYLRYFVQCLFIDNKANTYIDCNDQFKSKFNNIKFLLTEENTRKIKSNIIVSTKNLDIQEVCNTLSNLNKDIKVKIFPIDINNEIDKSNDQIISKEQNVIIIGTNDMLSLLNYKNNTQYGLDITYKIITKSFTRYKMMTIYAIDNKTNLPKLAALICLQNYDTESLKKIFGLLTVSFSFSPKFITTDYSYSQIKALKECETFNTKPFVVCCLFHYSQSIIKKMKKFRIFKKNLNKRAYEILRNLELLCFVILTLYSNPIKKK